MHSRSVFVVVDMVTENAGYLEQPQLDTPIIFTSARRRCHIESLDNSFDGSCFSYLDSVEKTFIYGTTVNHWFSKFCKFQAAGHVR